MNTLKYTTLAFVFGAAMAATPARAQDPLDPVDNRPAVVVDDTQTLPTAVRSTTVVAQPVAYFYRDGYYGRPAYRYGYAPRYYRNYGGPVAAPYPYDAYYYGGPRYYGARPYYYPYDGTARVGPMRFYWR